MALTKVALPVAEIAAIISGTSDVTIATVADDVVVTAAGTIVGTFAPTGLTLGAGLTLVTDNITTEDITLATVSGASGSVSTGLSNMLIETNSAHTLNLRANSLLGLRIETNGEVHLPNSGSLANHLIDKNYVDTALALKPDLNDIVATNAVNGYIRIPNSSGNDIIVNWGQTQALQNSSTPVNFALTFPNACLVALGTRNTSSPAREASCHVNAWSTTGMTVVQSGSGSNDPCTWLAIGY